MITSFVAYRYVRYLLINIWQKHQGEFGHRDGV